MINFINSIYNDKIKSVLIVNALEYVEEIQGHPGQIIDKNGFIKAKNEL
jgi:hypothetical protein